MATQKYNKQMALWFVYGGDVITEQDLREQVIQEMKTMSNKATTICLCV